MRLGLDIDGTINADPVFFGSRAYTVIKDGGEVHVVTSRSPEARAETVTELRELGIRYSTLHLLPHISAAQWLCPHRELDWYQRHMWLKVAYALEYRLQYFVDDDPKVLALFYRYARGIKALSFLDRHLL
jgi:hypothetical protein